MSDGALDGGTPVERAPLWALAITAVLLTFLTFPGAVGVLDALGLWNGRWGVCLAVGAGVSVLIVAILATRRPWRRDRKREKPLSARIATWLFASVFYPFLFQGLIAMFLWPKRADFVTSVTLGLILAAAQAMAGFLHRVGPGAPPSASRE